MNEDELLRRDFAIYVLNNFVMKKKFFKIHHDDFFLNHFTRVRTENIIHENCF